MVNWDSFDKIWASTSPLTPYEFSDPNYSQGWNFVGSTPPARQMWDSIQKQNDEKFKYLRDNFGTPNIVTQASQMTDTDKVYVYLGSEAGWNNGHWYYYDEGTSSWADGGVYNSVAFVTDTTLSIAGQPADAKATGDALALKSDLAGCTFTGNVSVNADFSVTGDASIGTDLSVTGTSTLTGNINAGADISAVGDVSADNLTTTTNATVGGSLSVAGTSTLTGNVTTNGNITAVGDISSANLTTTNATIGGNATVTGDVSCANLTTSADASVGGDLTVTGDSTLADTTVNDLVVNNDLSVAGDSSLINLSVSGTTALAGTSTAPTPSADDNSTKIATTEYVQTEIKPIETDVDIADKRITNIEKLLQGNLYDYQTDSTSAYTKSVPSGAMPYAGLESLGGKTVVWNQLVDSGTTAVSTISGHKYYTLIDGTASIVTADGTAITIVDDTADMVCDLTLMFGSGNEPSTTADFTAIFGATHYSYNAGTLLSAGVTEVESVGKNLWNLENRTRGNAGAESASSIRNWSDSEYYYTFSRNNIYYKNAGTFSLIENGFEYKSSYGYFGLAVPFKTDQGKTYTLTFNYTAGFGVGANASYYDKNGVFLSAEVLYNAVTAPNFKATFAIPANASWFVISIASSTANRTFTITNVQVEHGSTATAYSPYQEHSYPIPASIQALEGYGWSAGDKKNYIDFERKVFVKNVGGIDLSTLTWTYSSNWGGSPAFISSTVSPAPYWRGVDVKNDILTAKYETYSRNELYAGSGNGIALYEYVSGDNRLVIRDSAYSDATTFTNALSGEYMYFRLATAAEVDVSAYLTDDNLINVESGGTLTFPNSNGTDYQIPVPSNETYMIDLQASL